MHGDTLGCIITWVFASCLLLCLCL